MVRGIRGATTVSQNTKTDIVKETSTLLSEMISAN
ncbi:MAG: chorismate mutase, partial [SAR202 cluster bacterium]|nr:chorismate mutase [SAR202 cluster bacterium]